MTARRIATGQRGLAWALLVPFVLLSLLAPSTMPHRAAGGGLTIVVCTGDGPLELVIDPATGDPVPARAPDDDSHGKGAPCAFAAARAVLAELSVPVLLPAAPAAVTTLAPRPVRAIRHAAARFARPPARASPVLA